MNTRNEILDIESYAKKYLSLVLGEKISIFIRKEEKAYDTLPWHSIKVSSAILWISFPEKDWGLSYHQRAYEFAKQLGTIKGAILIEPKKPSQEKIFLACLIRANGREQQILLAVSGKFNEPGEADIEILHNYKVNCDIWALNISANQLAGQALVRTNFGTTVLVEIKKDRFNFCLIVRKKLMEDELKSQLETLTAKIYLGQISISAWDAMQLRAGQVIEFTAPAAFEAAIEVAGVPWVKTKLELEGQTVRLKVEEACVVV